MNINQEAVQLANGEFIKGFISGQFILCLLIFFFIKVFLLRNSKETRESIQGIQKPKLQQQPFDYKLDFKSESCDWISYLLGYLLSQLRNDTSIVDFITSKIPQNTSVGPVRITNLFLGQEFPLLKNARVVDQTIFIDFTYDDQVKIGIDTQALINWPKPLMASLPITLDVTLLLLSGTLQIELKDQIYISVLENVKLEFQIQSLIGHRTKIKDLPKLTFFLKQLLRNVFVKEFVFKKKAIRLPPIQEKA